MAQRKNKIHINDWFKAVDSNDLEKVKEFVEKGIDINVQSKTLETTALMFAVGKGYEDIVQYLIGRGADINKPNDKGTAPLLVAACEGREIILKYLIEHGADVNKRDNEGLTPLMFALRAGHKNIVEYLMDHGADVEMDLILLIVRSAKKLVHSLYQYVKGSET